MKYIKKLRKLADWMESHEKEFGVDHAWLFKPPMTPKEIRDAADNWPDDNSGSDMSYMEEFSASQARYLSEKAKEKNG